MKATDVAMKRQRWLWRGRLLLGSVSLLVGKEGVGKSTLAAWLAAQATRGELDGELRGEPSAVLVVASEDDIAEVWKPRLVLARADLDLIEFLDMDRLGPSWNITDGIDEIRVAVERINARLVVIDAILDHLPTPKAGEGSRSPTFVRAALDPLKRMARDLGVCVPLGMHPPKGVKVEYRDMVQESQAFTAVARTGLLVAWHPEDGNLPENDRRRVILRGKGNYGRIPHGVAFRIASGEVDLDDGGAPIEHGYVTAVENVDVTISDLAAPAEDTERAPTKRGQATAMVRELLADGDWHPAGPICAALGEQGLGGKDTIATAKRRLGIETDRLGFPATTRWRLPEERSVVDERPAVPNAPCARSELSDRPPTTTANKTPHHAVEGLRVGPTQPTGPTDPLESLRVGSLDAQRARANKPWWNSLAATNDELVLAPDGATPRVLGPFDPWDDGYG